MILYFILWFILISRFDIEGFVIGIIISVCIYLFNKPIIKTKFNLKVSFYKLVMFFKYISILVKEIFIAGIDVAKIVLSVKPNISPCIITYKTRVKSRFYRLILCSSITLTPGTLTIDIDRDVIKVHCLTKENAAHIDDNIFEELLIRIEDKEEGYKNG